MAGTATGADAATELLTVGHGTLAAHQFADLLRDAGVRTLVDVRRYPQTRRHPHFGREALTGWARDIGIRYRWEERLGGRRAVRAESPHVALRNDAFRGYADHMMTAEFGDALDAVLAEAGQGRTAIMCAESVWWRCHRRLAADAAMLTRGADVRHLMHDGKLLRHQLTEGARAADGYVVYDLGVDRQLPL